MNKQERIIAILLGLSLLGWMFYGSRQAAQRAPASGAEAVVSAAVETASDKVALSAPQSEAVVAEADVAMVPSAPGVPEEVITLNGGEMTLEVSSHGAVLRRVTLNRFASEPGKLSAQNPAVMFDFTSAPGLELKGLPGLLENAAYQVARDADGKVVTLNTATEQGLALTRRIELLPDYQVKVIDTMQNSGAQVLALDKHSVSMGVMLKGISKNDMLSVDSLPVGIKAKTRYWDKENAFKPYLASGGLGCGGKSSAVGLPQHVTIPIAEAQTWVALKSRFFVTAFSASEANTGFNVRLTRDTTKPNYVLEKVAARVAFAARVLRPGESATREYTLFIGPKKLSLLQGLGNGMDAVMQFGVFTWFCKLLVPTLNFFHGWIHNYGIAIILLTFLVRIIFWPLTHKSTVSMKKMQDLQPKLKELQATLKDNPQKLQKETWALYRENKVNPMSSCLPMLIQIPVFIALFTVLRSAVELRYAPFLWIADLSEPENLLAGVLPIPLNILPFLMSATMALQSYLTPSTGDPQQQKMMMIMMPIMMLFMFYSFPAALSLYWTVSQVLSIVQMLMIRRQSAHRHDADGGMTVEAPLTRQQRRHAVVK